MARFGDGAGRFAGRTVVVTGGAGGIGRAVCAGFAAEGATVAVVDVNADAVADAVSVLGTRAHGFTLDVADAGAVAELMRRVHAEHGGPHVLVTLAGGSLGTPRDLDAIAPEHVDLVLDVNVKGTLYCCQAAAPHLGDGGAIVTVASIGGRQPSPVTGVPYAAAKAAVGGLTRRLAKELGASGVRVNAVAPGLFLTGRLQGMFDAMSDAERREVLDAIPLGRMPELREIADPVLFLASDEASYITGVTLDVNGGRYMPA
ncbi:MAG: SDR family oxidoreductase [Micromonosporaceae bacterium]|nr:SDR family oxidoreductase [Micromonosporaceae bacterium]